MWSGTKIIYVLCLASLTLAVAIGSAMVLWLVATDAYWAHVWNEDALMPEMTAQELAVPAHRCVFSPRSPVIKLLKKQFPGATASRTTAPYDTDIWTVAEVDLEVNVIKLKKIVLKDVSWPYRRPFVPCGRRLTISIQKESDGRRLQFDSVEVDLW